MLKITVLPSVPLIEVGGINQYLNYDFWVVNDSAEAWQIYSIQVSALDDAGRLLLSRSIGLNGISPAIHTLGKSEVPAEGELYIFNPFHTFDADLPLSRLDYIFTFFTAAETVVRQTVTVRPQRYTTKTDLVIPIRGRLMVYDGHDFLSHHRRVDLTHPAARMLGITSNVVRYGYDFCRVDEQGALFRGQGSTAADWYSLGTEIIAPGAGKIVSAANDQPDLEFGQEFNYESAMQHPELMEGNHVVIDHGNGEFSALVHMQKGSVLVQAGATVQQGQALGKIGFSGDVGQWVHLHYELRNGPDGLKSEGLPAYFHNFWRLRGAERRSVKLDTLETGELLEA